MKYLIPRGNYEFMVSFVFCNTFILGWMRTSYLTGSHIFSVSCLDCCVFIVYCLELELDLVVAGVAGAEDEEAVPGLVVKAALQRAVVL